MKYTTLYPHQRHQNLARLLLTIWLFTICSPEATCSPKATCSPEATLAVSPSASPASIEEVDGWVVVSSTSQAPNVAATQQTLAELTAATLSNEGNQAVLEKVPQAQQGLTFSDKNTTTSSPTNTPRQQHSEQSPTKTYEQKLPSLQGFQEAISSIAKRYKQTAFIVNHLLPIVVVGLLWTYAPYGLSPSALLELTRSDAKRTSIAIEKMQENNMLSLGIDDKLQ